MKIDLYTWSWNDQDRLGFLFRHYDQLVRRYVVYDDGSDDATLDILRANPKVEIRQTRFLGTGDSFILSIMPTIQSAWKESRGVAIGSSSRKSTSTSIIPICRDISHPAGMPVLPSFRRWDIRWSTRRSPSLGSGSAKPGGWALPGTG